MGKNDSINYPVQGAAFHCLLWSFIELDKTISGHKWDSKLIGQIHDSMILDVNPDELDIVTSYIRKITCEDLPKAWDWLIVPMDVEIEVCPVDGSWLDKSKI
jgi:DNA polymerase I-like protein with 3'-5' exonuclease and polymerase domains